jgi:asparagine synthetase B (glutamine-hydrolysing)
MAPRVSGFRFSATTAAGIRGSFDRLADAVAAADVPPALDVATLAARCVFDTPIDVGATPYVGIRAELRNRGAFAPFDEQRARTPAVARAQLRSALEATVEHAIRGARRVAVMTGGGVDSSALLALAQQMGKLHGVSVFAVAMDFGGLGDDRPYLELLERHLGCEVIRVRPEEATRRLPLLRAGADASPFTWPGGPLEVETYVRAKEHGAERVLIGSGGDEVFDGEPLSIGRSAHRGFIRAIRTARSLRGFGWVPRPVVSWVLRPLLGRFLPWPVQVWRARRNGGTSAPSWAGPVLVEHVAAYQRRRERTARRLVTEREKRTRSARRVWGPDHHEHLHWLLHQETVASGMDLRTPFLDESLRELVFGFDPVFLLDGGIRRGLFREAVRDLLPQALVDREDKAEFGDAFTRVHAPAGGVAALRDLASLHELEALGVARPSAFRGLFERFARGEDEGAGYATLLPVLAVEAFVREDRRRRRS